MAERIVVVGHGATTCLGRDMDATWDGLIAGKSGLKRQEGLFPSETFAQNIAGVVEDFGPGTVGEDQEVAKLEARSIHLAMSSARGGLRDAKIQECDYDPQRVAIVVGSAMGGLELYDAEHARAAKRKSLATSPYLIPGMIINQSAGQIAQHLHLRGPSIAPANACASGGHSIALAGVLLKSGEADLAVCGASESAFTPAVVNGFTTMKALFGRKNVDRSFEDPAQASRPFSVDRAGFVLSEGAAMLVLATESTAKRLKLNIQAELVAWSWNSDGHHMAMPDGESIARCLAAALERSGIKAEEIDYYNAHGTSTVVNDRVETLAIKQVFGDHARRLPISSIKGGARPLFRSGFGDRGGELRARNRRSNHSADDQSPPRPRSRPRLRSRTCSKRRPDRGLDGVVRLRRHERRTGFEEMERCLKP